MGLDLCVEGRSIPGHEAEWESIVRRFFADEEVTDAEIERFQSITEPAHVSLGAPRVGTDASADDWIAAQMADRMSREQAVVEFDGYCALAMIESDGLPKFTHAGLYDGVDETSFRGQFLESCTDILTKQMIAEAWNHRMPEEAVTYGNSLIAAARDGRSGKTTAVRKSSMFRALLGGKPESLPLEEQLEIVETAGRWFVFWGSRGHPIRAYF